MCIHIYTYIYIYIYTHYITRHDITCAHRPPQDAVLARRLFLNRKKYI